MVSKGACADRPWEPNNVGVPVWYSKAPLADGPQSDRDSVGADSIIHIEAGKQKKAPPKRRFEGPGP
jgi:hypothetical protein